MWLTEWYDNIALYIILGYNLNIISLLCKQIETIVNLRSKNN